MKARENQSPCDFVGVMPDTPSPSSKLGIAIETLGQVPINGLRHKTENGTNGWYIWCGQELSKKEDFFSPLHIEHIAEYLPDVIDFLDLPAGYRFLIDGNDYEDIWFEEELLNT